MDHFIAAADARQRQQPSRGRQTTDAPAVALLALRRRRRRRLAPRGRIPLPLPPRVPNLPSRRWTPAARVRKRDRSELDQSLDLISITSLDWLVWSEYKKGAAFFAARICRSPIMLGLRFPRPRRSPFEHIGSAFISCSLVLFFHVALALVPRFFPSFSLLSMLPVAALIMAATILLGRCLKRLLGVPASAPAFVLFNILFLWGVYIFKIRQAIPSLLDAIINAECALLLFGFYRIFSGDPGTVSCSSKPTESDQNDFTAPNLQFEKSSSFSRIRHCNSCKSSVKGFDHHCPAFGNCIGQKNQRLFVILLAGFIIAESSYTICSTKFITKSADAHRMEMIHTSNLVISTMLFCILQVLWQVVFLIWHIYCICFNIKTEEWINWKRYPEFQLVIEHQPGSPILETRFTNPYNKGILGNILDFLKSKD